MKNHLLQAITCRFSLSSRKAWRAFCRAAVLLLLVACNNLNTHEAARKAAVGYYDMLVRGDYEAFVGGYAYADSLPEDYRSQLVDAVAQTMHEGQMQQLCGVEALDDEMADSTATVLLLLTFADSTREQIQLPLVLLKDGWRMQ